MAAAYYPFMTDEYLARVYVEEVTVFDLFCRCNRAVKARGKLAFAGHAKRRIHAALGLGHPWPQTVLQRLTCPGLLLLVGYINAEN